MGTHLITGYAGREHITAADQGAYNAGTIGAGKYVLSTGNQFAAEVVSNNLIKIRDGDLMDQGRHVNIEFNDYEEVPIDNGIQGMKRNDLIVIRYTRSVETNIEKAEMTVLKGISRDEAIDPDYVTGDILNGDEADDFPLYRVKLNGLNIEAVEPLFTVIEPLTGIIPATDEDIDKIIGNSYVEEDEAPQIGNEATNQDIDNVIDSAF